MAEENTGNNPKAIPKEEGTREDVNPAAGAQVVTPTREESSTDQQGKKHKKHYAPFWNIIAWVGVLLTITAWVVLFYNDNAVMVISIPAVICSALGVHSRFRRTSITMLIASGVLLLVFILFWIVIKYILG